MKTVANTQGLPQELADATLEADEMIRQYHYANDPVATFLTSDGTKASLSRIDLARLHQVQENESNWFKMGLNGFGFTAFVDTTSDFNEDMLHRKRIEESNRRLRNTQDLNGDRKKRFEECNRHALTEGKQVLETGLAVTDAVGVGLLLKQAGTAPLKMLLKNEAKEGSSDYLGGWANPRL